MPICTTCTRWISHLYTVYESKYNLRLEKCTHCGAFADPYVEHDNLTLYIDLILLKRGVYRHLLYNRDSKPRRSGFEDELVDENTREQKRAVQTLKLLGGLVLVDAFIRWSHLNHDASNTLISFSRTAIGCLAETVAFHSGVTLGCCIALFFVDVLTPTKEISAIRREFRISLVPLCLFYSSMTKLSLLFLLTIWQPARSSTTYTTGNGYIRHALSLVDSEQIDREWIVRNILGGMSAGFGLRVILDSHPILTTMVILLGWIAKTAMGKVVSGWVGGDAWLEYSIPWYVYNYIITG